MKIENIFDVPIPAPETWTLLMDIKKVVSCLPGANLTEIIDELTYKGTFSIRLGPVTLNFGGTVRFVDLDELNYTATIKGRGIDAGGRGEVTSDLVFRLSPIPNGTRLKIQTDLQLSGSIAQYGRGAGMITGIANQITDQFANCLREQLVRSEGRNRSSIEGLHEDTAENIQSVDIIRLSLRALSDTLTRWIKNIFQAKR